MTSEQQHEEPYVALMLRTAAGDVSAFEALVEALQGRLIQYFSMLARDAALAEDLAQEVFLRLYRARASYRVEAKLETYLYRIAHNLWKDHLRRIKRRAPVIRLDEAVGVEHAASEETDPTVMLDWDVLVRAIGALPEKQRQVFLLSRIEEMSFPEISQVLEIPVGTVKSRMYHALAFLREMLGTHRGRAHA